MSWRELKDSRKKHFRHEQRGIVQNEQRTPRAQDRRRPPQAMRSSRIKPVMHAQLAKPQWKPPDAGVREQRRTERFRAEATEHSPRPLEGLQRQHGVREHHRAISAIQGHFALDALHARLEADRSRFVGSRGRAALGQQLQMKVVASCLNAPRQRSAVAQPMPQSGIGAGGAVRGAEIG